jgi:hypothetical protein
LSAKLPPTKISAHFTAKLAGASPLCPHWDDFEIGQDGFGTVSKATLTPACEVVVLNEIFEHKLTIDCFRRSILEIEMQ